MLDVLKEIRLRKVLRKTIVSIDGKRYILRATRFDPYEGCTFYYVEGEDEPFSDNDHYIEIVGKEELL